MEAVTGQKVGAYLLLAELGRGGMGVVWEAWDERLERRVAIKRLKPGTVDPRRAERLRREARIVAQLDHPAIVRILDLVERDDGDWIVMEHVAGTSVASRLGHGPLALGETLAIARDVAAGLAEAHGKGFLHRDLKAENVLVTQGGRGKILDFGLAQLWQAAGDEPAPSGEILGTLRAMSPEQVHGLELDPRSDLFSFGVLLYEMTTGLSPFRAPSDVETLDRVCRHQAAPVTRLEPGVPIELARLIDALLSKERERRPASAKEVAARLAAIERSRGGAGAAETIQPTVDPVALVAQQSTLIGAAPPASSSFADELRPNRRRSWRRGVMLAVALAGLALAALLWQSLPARAPRVVAVAPVVLGMGGGRADAGLVAAAVRAGMLNAVAQLDGLVAVSPDDRSPASDDPADLARVLAAGEVLRARLDCAVETCQLSLELRQGGGRQVARIETIEVPTSEPALVATAVRAAVGRIFPTSRWRPGSADLVVEPEGFARYLAVERAYHNRPAGWSLEQGIAELRVLRRRSPGFLEAYLLEATLLSFRHFDHRDAGDLDAASALLRQAGELAPEDPRVADAAFGVALARGRIDEAEDAFADLERLAPGDAALLARRSQLAERRGDGAAALATMRAAAERRPSWRHLLQLANLEIRQGKGEEARRTLQKVRRHFPDDRESLALLAQLELLEGDPVRAAALYRELVTGEPRFADLSNLGTAELLLGRPAAAADSFRRARTLAPGNAGAVLNLADAELLLGRRAEAARLYRQVVELVADDPTTGTSWQWTSVRAQALAHLGDARGAVEAIRHAEQLAPDNPQLAFEAALVYAVVGDRVSALVSSERALAGGVGSRWFDFPWFNTLRADPAFAEILAKRSP
jgi:tetratricopeptide (TPR) repeat protein